MFTRKKMPVSSGGIQTRDLLYPWRTFNPEITQMPPPTHQTIHKVSQVIRGAFFATWLPLTVRLREHHRSSHQSSRTQSPFFGESPRRITNMAGI